MSLSCENRKWGWSGGGIVGETERKKEKEKKKRKSFSLCENFDGVQRDDEIQPASRTRNPFRQTRGHVGRLRVNHVGR